MTTYMVDGEVVGISRVYPGGKWCKVVYSDGHAEWVRAEMIEEVEE